MPTKTCVVVGTVKRTKNTSRTGFGAGAESASCATLGAASSTDELMSAPAMSAEDRVMGDHGWDSSLRVPVYGQPAPSAPFVFSTWLSSKYRVVTPPMVTLMTGMVLITL